jgi:hypothetical protein
VCKSARRPPRKFESTIVGGQLGYCAKRRRGLLVLALVWLGLPALRIHHAWVMIYQSVAMLAQVFPAPGWLLDIGSRLCQPVVSGTDSRAPE